MKLASALVDGQTTVLIAHDDDYADVTSEVGSWDDWLGSTNRSSLLDLFSRGNPVAIDQVDWLPPVQRPSKILAVGRNYIEHATELGSSVGQEPVIFSKLPSALIGCDAEIALPPQSNQIDFEAELVVVIGQTAKCVSHEDALQYVAGYVCGNDVTARDWQKDKPGGQWLLGKSFDTFAPIGPYMVTADEVKDPQDLRIELRLNGNTMQQSHTSKQVFPVDFLVAYLSSVATLEPGDLIFTGTPSGVGAGRKPPVFLKSGDVVEVEIDRLGCLRNRVV